MKKTFDILPLSPTQWVLVDKTRKPKVGEISVFTDVNKRYAFAKYFESFHRKKEWIPVLAAYPKIEGVLLLPSLLWEKQKPAVSEWAGAIYTLFAPHNVVDLVPEEKEELMSALKSTLEAARGYTSEDMLAFQIWINESEWRLFDTTSGTYTDGIAIISGNKILEKFIKKRHSPRALEIDVNEDGSIPSENGVVIYTEVIY